MSVLFGHDHKFRLINGDYYSSGNLGDDILLRYIEIFGSISVVARVIKEDTVLKGYSKITNKNIRIINRKELTIKDLNNLVKENEYIISRLPSVIGSEIAFIAQNLNKPCLIEMVGCPWDGLWNHSVKGKIAALPMMLITKLLVKRAQYVLYVTNEFLQKRYPTNGISIGCSDVALNGIDDSVINDRLTKTKNHHGKIKIGTAAALNVKYKGQAYVIQALAKLKKYGISDFEYQLIGGGDKSYLESMAKKSGVSDQVNIIGQLNHEQVFEWLKNIDMYIQPSLQEGLPRSVVEAMSCGLPCIGSMTGGIPELLDEDVIFKKKSVKGIVEIIKNINKEKMLKLSARNFGKAKEFDAEILKIRRREFYIKFKESIIERR